MNDCDWGYTCENGPETWCRKYPAAAGNRQSPIDIDTSRLGGCSCAPSLEMRYLPDHPRSVTNAGYSWSVDENGYDSELRGGPLGKDTYKLKNWHCHWGVNNDEGSEHTVDGRSFSGELHFVHWNTSRYTTFTEACERLEGLALISVFLTVGSNNKELDKVIRLLPIITYKNDRVTMTDPLNISELMPSNKSYWTYNGSITTPPCSEFVTWIIFKEPVQVSAEQLSAMRKLKSGDAVFGIEVKELIYNNRPTMPIGKRVVREIDES